MHDALLISEVLSCVIDHLAEDTVQHPKSVYPKDTRKAGRRALAVLARTCRSFSEPALDAVWCRLHSLKPFMLCLPGIASTHGDTRADGALPVFEEQEWGVVLRYAPRVQELTLGRHDRLSVKILQSLRSRTSLLLPNLRTLHFVYEDASIIAPIRLLLSPSLVHLNVSLEGSDHGSAVGLLECYRVLSPNLKSLYFSHIHRFSHVATAIFRAISRSTNLETLACIPIDEVDLIHVSNSRGLKRLTATLRGGRQWDGLRGLAAHSNPDYPPFENLRVLELKLNDLSSIIPYLKSYQQPFEEVSLECRMDPTPEMLRELFTALGSTTRQRTLRLIRLLAFGSRKRGTVIQVVDFAVLSLLMIFDLHTLDVNLTSHVSLTDDEHARLVRAWPGLEVLHFNRQLSGWDHESTFHIPTLRGLLLVADLCPKLRDLGLCIDARNVPSLSDDESSISNTSIAQLVLANSPIEEQAVGRIAQFLLEHFPSLTAVPMWVPFGSPSHDYRYIWMEIDMLVRETSGHGPCRVEQN